MSRAMEGGHGSRGSTAVTEFAEMINLILPHSRWWNSQRMMEKLSDRMRNKNDTYFNKRTHKHVNHSQ